MRVCAAPPFAASAPRVGDARWRAHDLLKLKQLPEADDEPAWVRAAFARAPFAVVRRAEAAAGFVAAGVRGTARAERYGTWINTQDIELLISPEVLLDREPSPERATLPAFVALAALRAHEALNGYVWGPAGSVGFELAAQVPTITASSDLDVLIRVPQRCDSASLHALADALATAARLASTRVDAQLETPAGGVALAELAMGKARVLVRASDGARLVADPWQARSSEPTS
ncbi:malonate decarboxylase holo-ACP synthase [Paraburkholderia sp. J94]|uniref:malonate decarboxylase holo-ACP synthase n=1 Tax=Paraburkholderia sp. J94 TaxID=2805441 RepID=UPI002AB006F3|nr:malonate decarboxylase holo-ACP synthase [Paraburkholderia sp. J94]